MKRIHRIAFLLIAAFVVLISTTCTIDSPLTAAIADKINEDFTVPVAGVSLDKDSITIAVGYTEQLTATVEPADATDQSVTWSSDNDSVVTVDAEGIVTAKAIGSATVTVTTTDGGFTASCSVTVVTNTVTIAAIPGVTAPEGGETPVTAITETAQYTGTVSWDPADDPFEYETAYTATITLTAKSVYTFTGVAADFFTVAGATTANPADSGVVTAIFPATDGPIVTYNPNGGTAGTAPTDSTDYSSGDTVTVLGNTGNLVGALVGGDHTGSGIKQRFVGWNTNSGATTAEYVAGNTFTITENTTLYAIYTTGTDVLQKVGPAGGWVFYDAGSTQSWGRYLEAAPESTEWIVEWGDEASINGDAQLTGIGDGQAATDAIVAHMESKSITGTAAQLCDNHEPEYDGTIYDDWFLASKDELNAIWENIVDDGEGNNSGVGGFAHVTYWSSSEHYMYSSNAWAQSYISGNHYYNSKSVTNRVRAVRAF